MEPILIDVPDELHTDRLRLRIPRVGDGPEIAAAVRASLAELKPWMPWAIDAYAESNGELWCRRALARFILREQFGYTIVDRNSGESIGGIGPHLINWKVRSCEIGYWLRTDRVGRGFMTEALNAVVATLDGVGLRRIEIRCDERNARSAAVAARCGFTHEGTLSADALDPESRPRSTMIFGRVVEVPTSPATPEAVQSA